MADDKKATDETAEVKTPAKKAPAKKATSTEAAPKAAAKAKAEKPAASSAKAKADAAAAEVGAGGTHKVHHQRPAPRRGQGRQATEPPGRPADRPYENQLAGWIVLGGALGSARAGSGCRPVDAQSAMVCCTSADCTPAGSM